VLVTVEGILVVVVVVLVVVVVVVVLMCILWSRHKAYPQQALIIATSSQVGWFTETLRAATSS